MYIMDPHSVIKLFQLTLGDLVIPVCISICDLEGLEYHSMGECSDLIRAANLIMGFEQMKKQVYFLGKTAKSSIITSVEGMSFYISELQPTDLFVVAYAPDYVLKGAIPLVEAVVKKTQEILVTRGLKELKS